MKYTLGRTPSGLYPQLTSDDALVRSLSIHNSTDCLDFEKITGPKSSYGSFWSLDGLNCFWELDSYERLVDMPEEALVKLASRMYELLFIGIDRGDYYASEPVIDREDVKYVQLLEELKTLQATEDNFLNSVEYTAR